MRCTSMPSVDSMPGFAASFPASRAISLSSWSMAAYEYLTSFMSSSISSKNANSNGISWPAPYLPSQDMFTVVGVLVDRSFTSTR